MAFRSPDDMIADLRARGIDFKSFQDMVASTGESLRPETPVPFAARLMNFASNGSAAPRRPNTERIQMLQKNPDGLDDLCPANDADKTACFVRSNVLKAKAEQQLAAKAYNAARATYIQAASEMIASPLPSAGSDIYGSLRHGWHACDLMGCLNGAIECSRQLKEYDAALMWLEEAERLDRFLEIAARLQPPSFEWKPLQIPSADYYFERMTALCLASAVFLAVGNTGSAVHRRWLADEIFGVLPDSLKTPQMGKLTPLLGRDILRLRHPDPKTAPGLEIDYPGLQICGSWQKLSVRKSSALISRMRSAVLAFDGHLYVLGGEKFREGPWHRDFWTLDLAKLDGWKQLPDFPLSKEITGDLVGFQMAAHRDGRAFVFVGLPLVPVFDLKRRKWSVMPTTFIPDEQTPEWPYMTPRLMEYTAQCVGDRLFVFGGIHRESVVGTDLFMELHIPSRKWRRLSGSAVPVPSTVSPAPREQCHSWVGQDKSRIFVMFGEADRQAAMLNKQTHGGFYSYAYADLWSWDIKAEVWTRERLHGNVPSPRSEMACTYNPVLDRVILFGGYSPAVPTWFDDMNDTVTYSYYADTFTASTHVNGFPDRWHQVLTRGFPTYRAMASLVTDTKTGKTFLFGGYKNTTYVPTTSKNKEESRSESRSFMDLWQLRLDVPGGFFEEVDLEEEARTARAGPWQRCFACGSTGPWKRCGGACNGRVFFCDSECLKEGWKEHKDKHGCRKAS
ncbi:hypothetical protein C8R47DRAFT_1000441 [Mycena vitilis]|nr:hypothetical protein C8R47DRAFT_1000441 [Mycena vitilis]